MGPQASVLIVGAGPTGLTLALTLRRHGIAARVIDKLSAAADLSKALVVWPASLEVLSGLGVGAEFSHAGVPLQAVVFGDGAERLTRISMEDGIDSAHPQPILLPQSQTEAILAERLAQMGGTVQRGVDLTGLTEDADGVSVTLRHADGREEITRAAWVIGADGAKSAVRHALGIDFEGDTEHYAYWLGDVRVDGAQLDAHSIHIWWHDGGTIALFPFEQGIWRVICRRPREADDEGDAPPTLEQLQHGITRHGPPGAQLSEPGWLSTFHINERLATRYRGTRAFLAGDAAHIHSPAGGQGMNTGIQDAANLGWKLAYVLQGRGHPATLLDSYEAERRPVAREVVKNATRLLHVGMAPHPLARMVRDAAVRVLDHMPALQMKLRTEMSETDVTYHAGPLVALGEVSRHAGRGAAGTRALDIAWTDRSGDTHTLWPLLSERHTLLTFGDTPRAAECVAAYEDAVATVMLNASPAAQDAALKRYGFDGAGWVLIRPDMVIALRGTDDDIVALERYLAMVIAPGAV